MQKEATDVCLTLSVDMSQLNSKGIKHSTAWVITCARYMKQNQLARFILVTKDAGVFPTNVVASEEGSVNNQAVVIEPADVMLIRNVQRDSLLHASATTRICMSPCSPDYITLP